MSHLIDRYFGKQPPGAPFKLFGKLHLIALGVIVAINVGLALWKPKKESTRKAIRTGMAAAFVANEGLMHYWHVRTGQWSHKTVLPLHLCGAMIYTNCYLLVKPNDELFQMSYYLSVPGAMQALVTPDAGIYELPHFRAVTTFVAHGLLVTAPIYMATVEGYRPRAQSIPKAVKLLNLLGAPMLLVNRVMGSNYMFINRKPDTPSLLDKLGPWPVYLIWLEALAVVFMGLAYLPFAIARWLKKS